MKYQFSKETIDKIRETIRLHPELRMYLSHHLRNALMSIDYGILKKDYNIIQEARDEILQRLEEIDL